MFNAMMISLAALTATAFFLLLMWLGGDIAHAFFFGGW
jgi:hypothetical protein